METAQLLGLITGILFGVLLQKGRVLRFEKQIGALLLKDMTILKFMFSAILVGMIGINLLADIELIKLSHKSMNFGAVIVGGGLFGVGWALMGYCPGTSLGALGEGRWHAIFAVLGMLAGAAIYAEIYPAVKATILSWKDLGKVGLPEILNMPHWVLVAIVVVTFIALFRFFEKKNI